jgi:hypothetical protein
LSDESEEVCALAEAMVPELFANPADYLFYGRRLTRKIAIEAAREVEFRLFKAGYVIASRRG